MCCKANKGRESTTDKCAVKQAMVKRVISEFFLKCFIFFCLSKKMSALLSVADRGEMEGIGMNGEQIAVTSSAASRRRQPSGRHRSSYKV